MNTVENINQAMPIFLQYRSLEDEDLLGIFIKKGFEPSVARKLVVFMPLAFGRTIMNELGVETSDEFEIVQIENSSFRKQRRKLKNVEIYRESFRIAFAMPADERNDETFLAIAGRSAEVNAVHQMKAQGVNPANGVLTAMATMWEIEEEEPYQNFEEENQTKNTGSPTAKSWWEFWK